MVASIGTPLMAPVNVNDPLTAANDPAGMVAENPPSWRVTSWVKGSMLPLDPGVNVPCTVNPLEAGWIWAAAEKAANGTTSASTHVLFRPAHGTHATPPKITDRRVA